ncbi:putative LysR family regulatory protein [Colletotrichum truncatum]|uniref:LysR family regulatory protein n=1 Tax=Colletotrichum truncatum TaxID=5467 RepID=A0ACC3Z7J6_COLTU
MISNGSKNLEGQVLPLEPKDQVKPVDDIRSLLFFIIRQSLNEEILRTSLDHLIRNHLPILGARIRPIEKNGGLAYHFPDLSTNQPLFGWSSCSVDTTLAASQLLPSGDLPEDAVTWGRPIMDLEDEWTPIGWPKMRHDDGPNTPTLLVHLTHYKDGTVVSTNLPHAVVDQMGYGSFIRAWLQVANGVEPAQFIELERGALDGPKDISEKALRRKGTYRVKSLRDRIGIIVGLVAELAKQPDEVRRLMFFPEPLIVKLRKKHQATITSTHGPDHPQLTNGDILVALLLKLGNLHRKKPKMMVLSGAVNALIDTLKPDNIDRAFAVNREIFRRGYVFGHSLPRIKRLATRFNAQIMCKADDGYWCDFTACEKSMVLVDKLMESDPSLGTL